MVPGQLGSGLSNVLPYAYCSMLRSIALAPRIVVIHEAARAYSLQLHYGFM